jgi:hypothetical protein
MNQQPRRIRYAVRLSRFYAHRWACLIRFWSMPARRPTQWHLGIRSN